jgi:hypothetical protein
MLRMHELVKFPARLNTSILPVSAVFLYLRGALDRLCYRVVCVCVRALNTQVDKLGLYACAQAVKQRWRLSTG